MNRKAKTSLLLIGALLGGSLCAAPSVTPKTNGTVAAKPNMNSIPDNRDGPTVKTANDGTKIINNQDGSSVQIHPDGTLFVINSDGSTIQKNPDGSETSSDAQ